MERRAHTTDVKSATASTRMSDTHGKVHQLAGRRAGSPERERALDDRQREGQSDHDAASNIVRLLLVPGEQTTTVLLPLARGNTATRCASSPVRPGTKGQEEAR